MNLHVVGRPWTTTVLVVSTFVLPALCAGCGERRARSPRPPAADGATIGRDLRAAPAGSVLPATSLGVDMVRESPPPASPSERHAVSRDEGLSRVGHWRDGSMLQSDR